MTAQRAPLLERIERRIERDPTSGCWLWTGFTDRDGYGKVNRGGTTGPGLVHRLMWEALVGPLADGAVLDHLCHNRDDECTGGPGCAHRRCCNPEHLEPTTRRVNSLRGRSPLVQLHQAGTCQNGHDLVAEGSRRKSGPRAGTVVYCKACRREKRRREGWR